jgi:hypothetical protein
MTSAPGGSDVETSVDHHRYRYMVLEGARHTSPASVLRTELRRLSASGWDRLTAFAVHGSGKPQASPVDGPGAVALIDGPKIYAALQSLDTLNDAEQALSGSPITDLAPLKRALKRRQPLLYVMLGNGRHH